MRRKDATLIKDTDPFHVIVPYIMPKKTEAEVSITEDFDVTELRKYIGNKKVEGKELKLFHCVCYAVARTLYHRPKMNIFISGKKYWQRNDTTLSFVAKQKFDDEALETLVFLKVKPDMKIEDVSKIVLGDVNKARKDGGNDLDKKMGFVSKLPRFILKFIFFIFSKLEYHGKMPSSLTEGDPNYSSVLLSNLGSIGAGAPYHHLNNYGTCSIMITIGTLFDDKTQGKTFLPMTMTFDERIADGFYFAKSLKYLHHILANPRLLEEEISKELDV